MWNSWMQLSDYTWTCLANQGVVNCWQVALQANVPGLQCTSLAVVGVGETTCAPVQLMSCIWSTACSATAAGLYSLTPALSMHFQTLFQHPPCLANVYLARVTWQINCTIKRHLLHKSTTIMKGIIPSHSETAACSTKANVAISESLFKHNMTFPHKVTRISRDNVCRRAF